MTTEQKIVELEQETAEHANTRSRVANILRSIIKDFDEKIEGMPGGSEFTEIVQAIVEYHLLALGNTYTDTEINEMISHINNALSARISEITETDTSVVITGSYPTTTRAIKVNISTDPGNLLQLKQTGLFVSSPTPQGSIQAADTVIEVYPDGNNTKLSMNVSASDNTLSKESDGAKVNIDLDYSPSSGKLFIKGRDGNNIGTGVTLPLDSFLKHAAVITVPPQPQFQTYISGGNTYNFPAPAAPLLNVKYLALVFIDKTGADIAVYVGVQELVDVYQEGDGINIDENNVISIKIQAGSHLAATSEGLGVESGWTLVTKGERATINNAITQIWIGYPDGEGLLPKVTESGETIACLPKGSDGNFGVVRLYDCWGQSEFGTITQKFLSDNLADKRLITQFIAVPVNAGVATIDLMQNGYIYKYAANALSTINVINSTADVIQTFELHIFMQSAVPIAFGFNVVWIDGVAPTIESGTSVLVFRTVNGVDFVGNLAYTY